MAFSLVYISYAYTGWNAAAYLAGEVGDPGRRLPRAMLLGTVAVVALYLGLNAVYALALPAAEVGGIADATDSRRRPDRRTRRPPPLRRQGGRPAVRRPSA